jgi:hypothetical protein
MSIMKNLVNPVKQLPLNRTLTGNQSSVFNYPTPVTYFP